MIYGTVNEFREATVELVVLGHTGQSERLEFVVDTGFDGSLSMHSAIAAALELPTVARGQGVLADGSTIVYDVCEAFIQWNGEMRPVSVGVLEGMALLGMDLLHGHELRLEAVPKGDVQITPLGPPQ